MKYKTKEITFKEKKDNLYYDEHVVTGRGISPVVDSPLPKESNSYKSQSTAGPVYFPGATRRE